MGTVIVVIVFVITLRSMLAANTPLLQAIAGSAVISFVAAWLIGELLNQIAIALGYNAWLFALIVVLVAVISAAAGYAYARIQANSGPGPFNPFG
jgi:uncharacterized membrane protein